MEEVAGPSGGGQGSSADAVERLRQRRRQKILANQGSRLDKILGADNSRTKSGKEKVEDPPTRSESIEESEEVVNIYRRRPTIPIEGQEDQVDSSSVTRTSTTRPVAEEEEHVGPALGFYAPRADGSTIHPKLPSWLCRLCLCILGMCLSIFNGRYIMVTFFSWEIAVLGINGLPVDESPSSVLILLVALMGLKEPQLQRLKLALKFGNCIITDLSLFIVFSLLPKIVI